MRANSSPGNSGIFKNTQSNVVLSQTSGANTTYAPEISTFNSEALFHLHPGWTGDTQVLKFNDPTDDIIHAMNSMMYVILVNVSDCLLTLVRCTAGFEELSV
jgi:hypothetical protein